MTPRTLDVAQAAGRTLAADASAPARPARRWRAGRLGARRRRDAWRRGYARALLPQLPRESKPAAHAAGHRQRRPVRRREETAGGAEALAGRSRRRCAAARGDLRPRHSAAPRRRAPARPDLAASPPPGRARLRAPSRASAVPLRGSDIIDAAARLLPRATSSARGGAARSTRPAAACCRSGSGAMRRHPSRSAALASRNDASVRGAGARGRVAVHGSCSRRRNRRARLSGTRPVLLLPGGSMRRSPSGWWWGGICAAAAASKVKRRATNADAGAQGLVHRRLAELVPVRRTPEPGRAARHALSAAVFAHAQRRLDPVPADSEGFAAARERQARPWP